MTVLRFGLFELDSASGELKRAGVPVKLQLQPGKVLALLASAPGRLFTRDEIQSLVWGQDTQVDFEQGLNYCIKEIRAALSDRADSPVYVETLPRRGYRFIAPVEDASSSDTAADVGQADAQPEGATRASRLRRRYFGAAATAAVVIAAVSGLALAHTSPPGRIVVAVLPFENLTGEDDYRVFADGLTEETQLQLGGLQPSQLTVIARTTARGYAQRPHPIAALVDEIGVDYVLEGSVRHCAKHGRLRITARLVRASDRREIWSDRIHQPLDDMVEMQRAAASALATRAGVALARREPSRLDVPFQVAESTAP